MKLSRLSDYGGGEKCWGKQRRKNRRYFDVTHENEMFPRAINVRTRNLARKPFKKRRFQINIFRSPPLSECLEQDN